MKALKAPPKNNEKLFQIIVQRYLLLHYNSDPLPKNISNYAWWGGDRFFLMSKIQKLLFEPELYV